MSSKNRKNIRKLEDRKSSVTNREEEAQEEIWKNDEFQAKPQSETQEQKMKKRERAETGTKLITL